jgi:hypothetical protein
MNITLTWTPGAGASNQDVQYKLSTEPTIWTTHSSVAAGVATATINGLLDNRIYDFRVVTNCAGGISTSAATQQINIICPTVTTNPSSTTIGFSFPEIGGSITGYTAKIFDTTGTTLISSQTPAGTTTRTGSFTSLTASTNYKIRIEIAAGSFSKTNCSFISVTTTASPTCNPPTGVTATLV